MAPQMDAAMVVFVMAGSEEEAVTIGRTVVDERLAACANIVGPVRSIFRWRGAVEDAREHWLVIKTREELYTRLERRVLDLHSYEVPEILAFTPAAGFAPYLAWILESTPAEPPSNPSPAVR